MTRPRARIREIDGQMVLDDPDALALVDAVGKHNCAQTLEQHRERVEHFARRIGERGSTPREFVIVVINVDDQIGRHLTEMLMPGQEATWAAMRACGEKPYARGLAGREGIADLVRTLDPACHERLAAMRTAALVVDHGTVEAFEVGEA